MTFEVEKAILPSGEEVLFVPANLIDPAKYIEYARTICTETSFTCVTLDMIPQDLTTSMYTLCNMANDETRVDVFCVIGDQIVGYASAYKHTNRLRSHRCNISVEVLKDFWNKGIGRALMTAIIDKAYKELSAYQLELEVHTINYRAQSLYRSMGFQIVGEIPHTEWLDDRTALSSYIMVM